MSRFGPENVQRRFAALCLAGHVPEFILHDFGYFLIEGSQRYFRRANFGAEIAVDTSAGYVAASKSFLKVEQQCEEHLAGYLKETTRITAGPQPIIAYLLNKENEIRRVRLLLTARKSSLDAKLILDRIS